MRPPRPPVGCVAAAAVCLLLGGCYNAEELVKKARSNAIRTRLDEVEIGTFRVTLPRNERTAEMTEIDVRIFGETERYKVAKIRGELTEKEPLVEDFAMRTLRQTTQRELADPELMGLRNRLLAAINGLLTDTPLKAIGFYEVRFIRH